MIPRIFAVDLTAGFSIMKGLRYFHRQGLMFDMTPCSETIQQRGFEFAVSPAKANSDLPANGLRFLPSNDILSNPAIVLTGLVILVGIILILVGGSGIGL